MILFRGAALLVEGDQCLCIHRPGIQAGPPAFHGQFREQQGLALAIFGAFDQANDPPSLMGAAVEDPFDELIEQGHLLARANLLEAAFGFRTLLPGLRRPADST
ncbi:hypothetical protein [Thiolapillus sp.]|uniref:hypothetical protein n=1 Tax=Thiolapillus sp. TaxID=2017437 RepID=UPI003AF90DC7